MDTVVEIGTHTFASPEAAVTLRIVPRANSFESCLFNSALPPNRGGSGALSFGRPLLL